METRKKLDVFEVDYKCPKCETGFLRSTGSVLPMNPPIFPHKCNNPACSYLESFTGKSYPHTEYQEHKVAIIER